MKELEHTKHIYDAADLVSEKLDANVFVYSGDINENGFGKLVEALPTPETSPLKSNALLVLVTAGGDPNAAYRIARMFQEMYENFYLFVPLQCKSAGTLIALGAHQIIMTEVAELGPLDVQLHKRNELGLRRSVLVAGTALEGLAEETLNTYEEVMLGIYYNSKKTISFEVASRIAAMIATGVMKPIYAQIDPLELGNDLRNLRVATAYGKRLIRDAKNAQEDTIKKLVHKYPSHDFIIDKKEAKELFVKVEDPIPEILVFFAALYLEILNKESSYVGRFDNFKEVENGKGEGDKATSKGENGDRKTTEDGAGDSRMDETRKNHREGDSTTSK